MSADGIGASWSAIELLYYPLKGLWLFLAKEKNKKCNQGKETKQANLKPLVKEQHDTKQDKLTNDTSNGAATQPTAC